MYFANNKLKLKLDKDKPCDTAKTLTKRLTLTQRNKQNGPRQLTHDALRVLRHNSTASCHKAVLAV